MGARGMLALLLAAASRWLCGADATFTDASGSHAWEDAANWSPAAPGAGDAIVLQPHAVLVHGGGSGTVPDGSPAIAGITCLGDATISGGGLTLRAPGIRVRSGTLTLRAALRLDGDATITVEAGARLEILSPIMLGANRLAFGGAGTTEILGTLSGDGGVDVLGPGRVDLGSESDFAGGARLLGGEAWIVAPAPLDAPGPGGLGGLTIDGGTLVIDADGVAVPIAVGAHGGRLDAHGRPRSLDSSISLGGKAGGGLVGTYCNQSLRAIAVDDWRGRGEVTGTRLDAAIDFETSSMGSTEELHHFRIQGTPDNWDNFSVQWDGFLRVEAPGTVLSTCSDDGSRVWLGGTASGAWGSNGWGGGQGETVRPVSGPLSPGIYPIRIQYEDGGGPNCIALLWSDAAHSQGEWHGLHVVPSGDLMPTSTFAIGGDDYGEDRGQDLSLAGDVLGVGALTKIGASRLFILGAAPWARIAVEAGALTMRHALRGPPPAGGTEVMIGEHGTLALEEGGRLARLDGAGALTIANGELVLDVDGRCRSTATIDGKGRIRKLGTGCASVLGTVAVPMTADEGEIIEGDATILAGVRIVPPLSTRLDLPIDVRGPRTIAATITLPVGAPEDLGWGVAIGDAHGNWCQRLGADRLHVGTQDVRLELHEDDAMTPEPQGMSWATLVGCASRTVFCLSSASGRSCHVSVAVQVHALERAQPAPCLVDLVPSAPVATGARAEWRFRPVPFPENPYDPDDFAADATITGGDGSTWRVPAFFWQGMRAQDGGAREIITATGEESFALRFRPRRAGTYRVHLACRWRGGAAFDTDLPSLVVHGSDWDGIVHVDANDHRFFAIGGRCYWPIGLTIRSVNDTRSQGRTGTKLTPDRGMLAYDAYLRRFAAAGGTCVEVWMAAWNLGLEWRADWNGFYGQGRYNQANAWKLDALLEEAEALGVHVNLVITNHGQGSDGADHEWEQSPYNRTHGGRLINAHDYFTDSWALAGQERYRRYLVARFSDEPAILGWKLWSEVNLTEAGNAVVAWHEHAAERWQALDPYHHPITTHWAGSWRDVNPGVARLPMIDYLCIDAYHGGGALAELLAEGIDARALGRFKKPVLVTECGGNWDACPAGELIAEQASAQWASLVCGYSGGAMLWWFEFVDQHDLWRPYGAIARFIAGEDLRGTACESVALATTSDHGALWCRAWREPSRWLGYCLDTAWQSTGAALGTQAATRIACGEVAAGDYAVEWWNADTGVCAERGAVHHGGGPLVLSAPAFSRHLAFKLIAAPATR